MQPDTMYFFTATIHKWIRILYDDKLKDLILNSLTFLVEKKAIRLYAFVIMPNHIHLVLKPLINPTIKNVQLSLMRYTAQKIKFYLIDNAPEYINRFLVEKRDRLYQIWQRNPLAIELYSQWVIEQKIDYIHNNPVQGKWMLANNPIEYKYSSARFYELNDTEFDFLTHYQEDI